MFSIINQNNKQFCHSSKKGRQSVMVARLRPRPSRRPLRGGLRPTLTGADGAHFLNASAPERTSLFVSPERTRLGLFTDHAAYRSSAACRGTITVARSYSI